MVAARFNRGMVTQLQDALHQGMSPSDLTSLMSAESHRPEDASKNIFTWSALAVLGFATAGVVAYNIIPPDITIPDQIRNGLDLLFTPGNAPVADATARVAVRAAMQWLIYAIQSFGIIAYAGSGIASNISRLQQYELTQQLMKELHDKKNSGELKLHMDSHIAIDLGEGDAIGQSIGSELGWGKKAMPYSETDHNVATGFDIWAKIWEPKTDEDKKRLFEYLDAVGFDKAVGMVMCPVKAEQSFAPDVNNSEHFDLTLEQILDRMDLIDEYVLIHHKGEIPLKGIMVIGDRKMKRTYGQYTGKESTDEQGRQILKSNALGEYTLEQEIDSMNNDDSPSGRKGKLYSQIMLVDPTDEIILEAMKLQNNPKQLPLAIITEMTQEALAYGERLALRCADLNVLFTTDSEEASIRLVHGVFDRIIKRVARHMDPQNIMPIIINAVHNPRNPYHSLFLTDVVKNAAISKMVSTGWLS